MPTVVILLSDKRSGSTMFQEELCRHPEIQTVAASPHTYLETHHWLKGAVMLDMAPEMFSGSRVYPGYGSRAGARAYMIDCIKNNVPDFVVPDDDSELVFRGWDALCGRFAQPVFFEKSPQLLAQWSGLSLLLEWIKMTDYKVKVIGLTRNPLAVLYSAHKLFHTDPGKRQYGWLEIQKNLLAFQTMLSSDSFLSVNYEDIINRPVEIFAEVCRFIGVPKHPEVGKNVRSSSLDKWRDDAEFTLQLDKTVKQMANHFGYSAGELVNPGKTEPTALRSLCSRILFRWRFFLMRFRDRIVRPLRLWLQQK